MERREILNVKAEKRQSDTLLLRPARNIRTRVAFGRFEHEFQREARVKKSNVKEAKRQLSRKETNRRDDNGKGAAKDNLS